MFKKILIAASLLASTSAFATVSFGTLTDPDQASSFADGTFAKVDFSSSTNFDLSGSFTTSKNLSTSALFKLSADGLTYTNLLNLNANKTTKDNYTFSFSNLLAGTYQLRFNVASGGTITGNYTLSPITTPVPEPETYGMMFAGLALIGSIAARRQKKN